jgi:hypothetical protein
LVVRKGVNPLPVFPPNPTFVTVFRIVVAVAEFSDDDEDDAE